MGRASTRLAYKPEQPGHPHARPVRLRHTKGGWRRFTGVLLVIQTDSTLLLAFVGQSAGESGAFFLVFTPQAG